MTDRSNDPNKFDDPVYEHIKEGEKDDIAANPLYDGMKSTSLIHRSLLHATVLHQVYFS